MNSLSQLIQNVKSASWSNANQVFAEIMQQKVADRLASERQTIFKEEADDTKYQEYFRSMLKKHGYDSPADIPDDKKDDFFNAVDKGYKAKDESTKVGKLTEDKKPYVWECQNCGNIWRSAQGGNASYVRCPKCHDDDVLPGVFKRDQRP